MILEYEMARIIVCVILLQLSFFSYMLNADENVDVNDVNDTVTKAVYKSPEPSGFAYIAETFDDKEKFESTWILSETKKEEIDEEIAKYDGIWSVEEPKRHPQDGDLGLVLKSKARHAAISTQLVKPFYFKDKPLIVQYEVNFQEGQECGGAYLKLLSLDEQHKDLKNFQDKTPYTIMFGPDKCGNDHQLHFIFRHKNPLNGTIEEKHCKKPKERLEDFFKDKQPHLYTLFLRPDNTFEIKIDNKIVNSGSLLDDFTPPVNPPLEVEDPNDKHPEDWDDREKIPDPLAVKPDDWDEDAPAQIVDEEDTMPNGWLEDEPPMIPNPDSVKPDDWDIEMDGEWEPPEIPNPKCADVPGCGPYKQRLKKNPRYKGKWIPPLINNPNYKGKWKPRLIHNPDYFNDEHPFLMTPIFAVGFELWSMSTDILFDNIIITDDEEVAKKWADDSFEIRRDQIAKESWAIWRRIATFTAEHPSIWVVHILIAGLPIVLLIQCCCFSGEDKCDSKDEDSQPLEGNLQEDIADEDDNEIQQEPIATAEITEVDTGEVAEASSETVDILEEDKDKSLASGDGPRRRKPHKE